MPKGATLQQWHLLGHEAKELRMQWAFQDSGRRRVAALLVLAVAIAVLPVTACAKSSDSLEEKTASGLENKANQAAAAEVGVLKGAGKIQIYNYEYDFGMYFSGTWTGAEFKQSSGHQKVCINLNGSTCDDDDSEDYEGIPAKGSNFRLVMQNNVPVLKGTIEITGRSTPDDLPGTAEVDLTGEQVGYRSAEFSGAIEFKFKTQWPDHPTGTVSSLKLMS